MLLRGKIQIIIIEQIFEFSDFQTQINLKQLNKLCNTTLHITDLYNIPDKYKRN
jgi:hypothetical protein